jgi:hypothetical protein
MSISKKLEPGDRRNEEEVGRNQATLIKVIGAKKDLSR